ncbi:MAG: hypothetical protein KDJ27_19700 [Gammaproteobacteria bacterium]|nr:hypothetical protein [Gammaproteobacteria bacterium]
MAFVNDYASEEEIGLFGLKEMWDKYFPEFRGEYWVGRKPDITINREINAYLMPIGNGGESGRGWRYFLLWLDGVEVEVVLKKAPGSSTSFSDSPFKVVWGLVRINISGNEDVLRSAVMAALKSALAAYGYRGVHRQVENTLVEFSF